MTTDKSENPDKNTKNKEPEPSTIIQHCFYRWPQSVWNEGDTGPCHFTRPGVPCYSVCPNWKSYSFKSKFMDWADLMRDKKYKGAVPKTASRGYDVIQMNIGYEHETEPRFIEKQSEPDEFPEPKDDAGTPPQEASHAQKEPDKKKNAWF